jgi:hypothetical protein
MRGETLPPFQSGNAATPAPAPAAPASAPEETFHFEAVEPAAENAPAEDSQDVQTAPAEKAPEDREEQKPMNSSFSGRWDSFSNPSASASSDRENREDK